MEMLGTEQLSRFPDSAEMPESKRHLELRTLLYLFLQHTFAEVAAIGCDQFVYWDPTDPRACLAPDAFVRFGQRDEAFRSWKVWERGAPHVALEILGEPDSPQPSWAEKLEKYRRLGVSELVCFDPDLPEQPLRVWDFLGDDLFERTLAEPAALSRILGAYWVVVEHPTHGPTLRLSHDASGTQLLPTSGEAATRRADRAEVELRALKALLQRDG